MTNSASFLATNARVAVDMSAAYYQAVQDHLPEAGVVFDWFHHGCWTSCRGGFE